MLKRFSKRFNRYIVLFAISFNSAVGCVNAFAEDRESDQTNPIPPLSLIAPTEISSDSMDFDVKQHVAVFTGNVVVVDPQLKLNSDKMTVRFDDNDQLKHLEAVGNVNISADDNVATGGRAEYDVETGNLVLTDNPVLQQGLHRVVGADKIVYSRAERKFRTVDGRPTIKYYQDSDDKSLSDLIKDITKDSEQD